VVLFVVQHQESYVPVVAERRDGRITLDGTETVKKCEPLSAGGLPRLLAWTNVNCEESGWTGRPNERVSRAE